MLPDRLSPTLTAHRGLRGQILLELKRRQPLTARDLADHHGVTTTAVRRHLKELEADGLVAYQREHRGHGAPTYVFRLSAAGEASFPNSYEEALTAALAFVERSGGRGAVRRFFAERFTESAAGLMSGLADASLEERLAAVAELLSRQGYMAEWSADQGTVRIAEHNCAVHAVAQRFPEVCDEELHFLQDVLGVPVRRKQHIMGGCNACEYTVEPECPIQLTGFASRSPGEQA